MIGGFTDKCLEKGKEIYLTAIENLVPVSSCRVAEATKLTENIFRSVNIALVNELKMIYQQMGVDVWEIIEAAKTKPFGYMPFYPGPGLGGHCIPIDPFYLSWKANQQGMETRFIRLAGEINTSMPNYVIERLNKALAAEGKSIQSVSILIMGLAYKPNVDDDRESPSYALMEKLEDLGAHVDYFDPYISEIKGNRTHGSFAGRRSVVWEKESISKYDVALISTAHDCIDYAKLLDWGILVLDTRNAIKSNVNYLRLIRA